MEVITLVPKDNKLLIEIIEDEMRHLTIDLMNYKQGHDYIEDDDGITWVDQAEEIEINIIVFENIIEKIEKAFGFDFLPKLTNHELDNLAGAIEQKVTNLDFQEIYNKVKVNKDLKKEVAKLYEKIFPYYLEVNGIEGLDMFED